MNTPVFLTSKSLNHPSIRHGFFTRLGGVSQGLQDDSHDDLAVSYHTGLEIDEVTINRTRVQEAFGAKFVSAKQVHGAKVINVKRDWDPLNPPVADGLVTSQRALGIGVLTADCVPVLFADITAGVVGACHGGWRSLREGIIEATIAEMEKKGGLRERIIAVIGPCLGIKSYEVSHDFPANFKGTLKHYRSLFIPSENPEKLMFDLPLAANGFLKQAGLEKIDILDFDTLTNKDRFFSHRRATRLGQPDLGRQISIIAVN